MRTKGVGNIRQYISAHEGPFLFSQLIIIVIGETCLAFFQSKRDWTATVCIPHCKYCTYESLGGCCKFSAVTPRHDPIQLIVQILRKINNDYI
jgi:hypothetical protein